MHGLVNELFEPPLLGLEAPLPRVIVRDSSIQFANLASKRRLILHFVAFSGRRCGRDDRCLGQRRRVLVGALLGAIEPLA